MLALVMPRKEGRHRDVHREWPCPCRRTAYQPGKNTRDERPRPYRRMRRKVCQRGDSFWVSEVLEIPGDVDYSTGHIDFPGDVIVQGQIKQGFKVKAGGSLTCAKTMEASEIQCGGDLVTDQGILGGAGSTVKAGGQIRAKFIENCSVEGGGDVTVNTGRLNSVISTLGSDQNRAQGRHHRRPDLRPAGRHGVSDRGLNGRSD